MISPPIVISSPTRRSGTTLIQRLLTSAPNTLIYGETCANDFYANINFYVSKHLQLMQSKEWREYQISNVLAGNVNDWIPDLLPSIDEYLEGIKSGAINLLELYPNYAKKNNRPIWGMKYPEWSPTNLKLMGQFFPGYKVIYIKRNIEDCVRSAKNVNRIKDVTELEQFCQTGKMNAQSLNDQLAGVEVLHISYESLMKNPEPILKSLEEFTGAKGIDPKVLDHKFNAFKEKVDKNESLGRHVSPADLTEEEMAIVEKYKND